MGWSAERRRQWFLYWLSAWEKSGPAKLYSPARAIPTLVITATGFIWRAWPHYSFREVLAIKEMWIAIGTVVVVYFVLYFIETMSTLVMIAPVNMHAEQAGEISRLNKQVEDLQAQLKKDKLSPAQEKEWQEIRAIVDGYGEGERIVLKTLRRVGKMTDYDTIDISPLPPGLNRDRTLQHLINMEKAGIVTKDVITVGSGWKRTWMIAPGVAKFIEDHPL
jgi:hypothetical protein